MTDEVSHLRALAAMLAGELARAWCGGSTACRVRWEIMSNPLPGDLVVETSTHFTVGAGRPWHDGHSYADRLGRLLAVRHEPVDANPEDWYPDPIPTERVWYIALSDGRVHRWVNADFARLPDAPGGLARSRLSAGSQD